MWTADEPTSSSPGGSGSSSDDAAQRDQEIALSIMVMMILLGVTVAVAYVIQRTGFKYVHETSVAIAFGAVAGLVIHYANIGHMESLTTFNADLFYFLLLPPIIFNSGYDLNRRPFFKNIVGILSFAVIGTVIAALATGFLLYALICAGLDAGGMDLVDCLVFGSLISATDPVTVLAIFRAMHVEPKIFALVFGESMMNDAIAIALFESISSFKDGATTVTAATIFTIIGAFLGIFLGSFAIGTAIGCVAALTFKHTKVYRYPGLEATVFVVLAYISFMLAQGVGASGIVSMLFCGISMAHYAFFNMSIKSQQTTKYMFHLLSFMSENLVFSYVGMSIFTSSNLVYKPWFILASLFAVLLSRACNIIPISFVLNLFKRQRADRLTVQHQTMLWWSGLRGALAFMLATRVQGPQSPIILSTTLVLVVITVAFFGSSTRTLLEVLKIPIGVQENDDSERATDTFELGLGNGTSESSSNWFVRVNQKYIEPFLMSHTGDDEDQEDSGNIANIQDRNVQGVVTDLDVFEPDVAVRCVSRTPSQSQIIATVDMAGGAILGSPPHTPAHPQTPSRPPMSRRGTEVYD